MLAGYPDEFGFPIVELPAAASVSPDAAVQFLVGQLVQQGRLGPEHTAQVVRAIHGRESLGATALGGGVAFPRGISDAIEDLLGVIGKAPVPIAWPGAMDRKPVHTVCLLVTPTSKPGTSLRALAAVAKRFRGD